MQLRAYLLIGFTILAAFSLAADDPPPEVDLETKGGQALSGKLRNATIRLKTDYGIHEISSQVIQRVTLSPPDAEGGHDVIEFTDGTHTRGEILTETVDLETTEGVQAVQLSEIRELKARRKPQLGLVAILVGLLTLTAMEIVLGIDNIIFLTIIAGKLPEEQQPRARRLGLMLALGTRILLLLSLSFLLGLKDPIFTIPDLPFFHDLEAREVSLRDLILLAGGLFLIYKSVKEMHEKLEEARSDRETTARAIGAINGAEGTASKGPRVPSFRSVLIQIAILDIVFSLDSVITAVGMVDQVWVMIVAMTIAMGVMLISAKGIGDFVHRHPTLKILALAFLILIGVMLVAESLGQHMNKGYIYFAMAFAVVIEMINLRLRRKPAAPSMEKVAV